MPSPAETLVDVTDGDPRPLGAGVELAAFRILQEGLTNVLKHAPTAATRLVVRYRPDAVEVEVLSVSGATTGGSGTGRGLIGIAERAAFVVGRLDAGPRPEGGWRLRALLPVAR